ncbi:MAG: hypothetical protein J5766_05310 [Clostridia bacterium]|nr:hypothetical protein [Clostridia bacterium]
MTKNGNVITADDGKMLVRGETRSRQVILGKSDSPENWSETNMTEEERSAVRTETEKLNLKKIAELKEQLTATDYKAIKYFEGWISEEDYAPVKSLRQSLREQINLLEKSLTQDA